MSVRVKTLKIFIALKEGLKSLREISVHIGTSKSSVDRSLKAVERRNCHPESWLWETEDGHKWVHMFVTATVCFFGIKCGVGAETLSIFFHQIRLSEQFGASPTAIRSMIKRIEDLLVDYQKIQEEEQRHTGAPRNVIAGGDETFFRELLILVLVDLPSGYLLMEEVAVDRSYETWKTKAQERLNQMGLHVMHFVSDQAKALTKLAFEGFGCQSGADLFHGEYEITKWLGAAFRRQLGRATNQLKMAKERLVVLQQKTNAKRTKIEEEEKEIKHHEEVLKILFSGKDAYQEILHKISKIVHPFTLEQSSKQTSEQVENMLHEQAQELQKLAESHGIPDSKGSLEKFVRQIKKISNITTAWWGWSEGSLATFGLEPWLIDWLLFTLLPVIYWHKQMEKTKNPKLKLAYKEAYGQALGAYHANFLTKQISSSEIERWRAWAEWMVGKFQRTSSAVEGRNGWLSQMYHNGRGLSVRRLKALTVIHNYDLRRGDGTTAAERLYETQFPDLFEWIVGRMGELPLARKERERRNSNPLIPLTVPA